MTSTPRPAGSPDAIHVVLITHTTRHLRRTLLGVAAQRRAADTVTVSGDVDDDAIRELLEVVAGETGLAITLVRRPHQGISRSAQVRNNAVRALLARGAGDGLLVFLDGDCCPGPDVLETYERLRAGGDLVIGYRFDLTAGQTDAFDEAALAAGRPPVDPTPAQWKLLTWRHRRYRRAEILRSMGLLRWGHKPKVLSANFGLTMSRFRQVNGFDEEYLGWGGEDDDLGRRVYRVGGRPVVAVKDLMVYHLFHDTRRDSRWSDAPGVKRFLKGGPARCVHGVENPYPQDPVEVLELPARPRTAVT